MRNTILVSSVLILAFVVTSCVSKARYQDQQDKTDFQRKRVKKLEQSVNTLREEMATLINEEEVSDRQISKLKKTINQLNRRIDGLEVSQRRISIESREKTGEIQALNSQIKELNVIEESLRTALESGDQNMNNLNNQVNRLKRTRRNLDEKTRGLEVKLADLKRATRTILLPERFYFKRGSADLTQQQEMRLDNMTTKLQRHPNRWIAVEGHADTVEIQESPYSSNWDLSAKRATSVVEYLTENSELNHHRFVVMGRGEYEPERSLYRGEAGQDLDRRVLISFVPRPKSISLED